MRLFIFFIVTTLSFFWASAQEKIHYIFQHINQEDGFPANAVYAFHQDRQGYIWLGTDIGLIRYDGDEFITYRNPPADSMTSMIGNVVLIREDREGYIWFFSVKTRMYVNRLDPRTHSIHHFYDQGKPMHGYGIYEFGKELYLSTDQGIQRFNRQTMMPENWTLLDSTLVWPRHGSQWTDKWGRFWARGPLGMVCYNPHTRETISRKNNPLNWEICHISPDIFGMAADAAGNFWITTMDGEFYYFDFGTGKIMEKPLEAYTKKLNGDKIITVTLDHNDQVWFGTKNGQVCKYFPKQDSFDCIVQNRFNPYTLQPTDWIDVIETDREGNIWIEVRGGINHFNPIDQKIEVAPALIDKGSSDYAPAQQILELKEMKNGDLLINYQNYGLYWLDKKFRKKGTITLPTKNTLIKSFVETVDGKLWISGNKDWITEFDLKTRRYRHFKCTQCQNQSILNFFRDMDDNIWLALSGEAVVQWKQQQQSFVYYALPSLPNYYKNWGGLWPVSSFFQQEAQELWVATGGYGIMCINPQNGRILKRFYYTQQGTLEDIDHNIINCIEAWKPGSLLIGTNAGLKLLDQKRSSIQSLPISDELLSQYIRSIHKDKGRNFWLSTIYNGFYVLDSSLKKLTRIDGSDGFPPLYVQYDSKVFYPLRNGRLIAQTFNGDLFLFDPERLLRKKPAPYPPTITNIKIFNQPLIGFDGSRKQRAPLRLNHHQNNLAISYGSLVYSISGIRYQHRLKGSNQGWSTASKNRTVTYATLSPGYYQFEVKAIAPDGQKSSITTLAFNIRPPWFQQIWFYVTSLLLCAVLIAMYLHNRIQRLKLRESQQRRIADLENLALRAQINPHFIFNALQSIKKFVLISDVDQAEQYLSRFARLIRLIMDNSREVYVVLSQELELLELYLQLEQLRHGYEFDYQIDIGKKISVDDTEIPSMVLQPFVENAILHGLAHLKNRRGWIRLALKLLQGNLHIEIEDNGVGRAKAEELKSELYRQHYISRGLEITSRRLAIFSESSKQEAGFQIIDLFGTDGQSTGTKVKIWIPIDS